MESLEYNFSNYKDLYFYVVSKIKDDKKYYVFLDEIQNIEGFQKAVDIYITGSKRFYYLVNLQLCLQKDMWK